MALVEQIIQMFLIGIATSSLIAVAAVGLTLSYGISRFINFAYGDVMTYGAFVTIGLVNLGVPLVVAFILSILLVALLGVVLARAFFLPIKSRGPIPLLLTSFGLAFVLRHSLTGIVGTTGMSFPLPLLSPITLGPVYIPKFDLFIIIAAVLVMAAIHVMLQRTLLGRKMRAMSGNRQLARVVGINIQKNSLYMWAIASGIAALAGILYGLRFAPFQTTMGWNFLIVVFAAVILGGIGHPYGAMLGAFIIGLVMTFGTAFLSPQYSQAYAFVILVGTLLLRPEGIVPGEISGGEL